MFTLSLPILEKIARPILVYAFLVLLLRVFGKRELAQLNPFDLVVLLSVSNTVQNAIIGDDNSVTGGLIGAFALFAVNYLVVRFMFRHRRLDEILEGKPTRLIEDGHLCKDGLPRSFCPSPSCLRWPTGRVSPIWTKFAIARSSPAAHFILRRRSHVRMSGIMRKS